LFWMERAGMSCQVQPSGVNKRLISRQKVIQKAYEKPQEPMCLLLTMSYS
jgi:hypothetical protein